VLDDGVLAKQTWDRFATVLAPKVTGAWNLHQQTRDMPLDCFVLYSSAAALFGSPAQGNHAAANAFLDGLAYYRRRQGLPAISINWGPWSETGAATRVGEDAVRKWRSQGIGSISVEQGLRALAEVLEMNPVQIGAVPVDWAQFSRQLPAGAEPPLFCDLVSHARLQAKTDRPADHDSGLVGRLQSASEANRLELLRDYVLNQAIKVLGLSPSHAPHPDQHLGELGLDSLMAVELKNSLERGVGRPLPTTLVFDFPTIKDLVDYLAREWAGGGADAPKTEGDDLADPAAEDKLLADLSRLPEAKIDAMLKEMLGGEGARP
jgi:acyl carrier protein